MDEPQSGKRARRLEIGQNHADGQCRLSDRLREQHVKGVVCLSGDRRFSELLRVSREDAYPFYESTSSPLTAGVVLDPDDQEGNNPDLVPDTMVNQRRYGMVKLSAPRGESRDRLRSHDAAGASLCRHQLSATVLRSNTRGSRPDD
ncbi:MAG: hypothetical protein ABI794_01920 [Betaproteobacteria bacterium]